MKEEELQTPKIDLNLCTSDRNIPPLDKVFMMDEDSRIKASSKFMRNFYFQLHHNR